jgi:multiple antibiotic resistance protein
MMHWSDYTRFGIALFALLNPITKIPYALSAAAGGGTRAVITMALSCTVTMMAILLLMHFVGESILLTLGTSLASFQIGGGLIILLSGLSMLSDEPPKAVPMDAGRMDSLYYVKLGVSPLGMPMLAGAGAITKVVIETHPGFGIEAEIELSLIILLVCGMSGALIATSSVLVAILGAAFFSILSRIAGLVIVAVAVEVMSRGVNTHASALLGS